MRSVAGVDDEFWRLVEESRRFDHDFLDAPAQEQYLRSVLRFVQEHPSERAVFVRHFIDLALQRRDASSYLVPYCMRTLRYPEVLQVVEQAISNGQEAFEPQRRWPQLFDVREAFQEHWSDAVFWELYREAGPDERSS